MLKEERSYIALENCGQKMFGVFHKPVTKEMAPVVLVCHGFGGNKIGSNRLFVLLAEKLVQMGIATLRVDLRGSGDSEGDFKEMTLAGEVSDLRAWISLLEKMDVPIGLLGVSLGGAVSVLAAQDLDTIKSIALWAPVAGADQWQEAWMQEKGAVADANYVLHKGRLTSRLFFEQFFGMNLEESMKSLGKIPFFHAHGKKDDVVDFSHQGRYVKWRKESFAANQFVELAESDHTFSHLEEQKYLLSETASWFKKVLWTT